MKQLSLLFVTLLVYLGLTACGAKPQANLPKANKQRNGRPLVVLAGDPSHARNIAVLVYEKESERVTQAPEPYQAVLGYQVDLQASTPESEGRMLREAIDSAKLKPGINVDAFAEGLAGLPLRYAIERAKPGRSRLRRVVLVDTPNRGLSPTGWPSWNSRPANAAGKLPQYAVAGSAFLVELNGNPLSDLTGTEFWNIWRDSPLPISRASVLRLPRRGLHIVLRANAGNNSVLNSVMDAKIIALRRVVQDSVPLPIRKSGPEFKEQEVKDGAPKNATSSAPSVKSLIEGAILPVEPDPAKNWVRFETGEVANIAPEEKKKDLLAGVTDPVAIAYDPASNEVVITGYENYYRSPLDSNIFWAALRAYAKGYPGVSIDPPKADFAPGMAPVRYEGETGNTRLGGVMFEADRVMKSLSLGRDNISESAVTSQVLNHSSILAALTHDGDNARSLWRLWFEPDRWHMREEDPLSATIDAKVKCRWELMTPGDRPSAPVEGFTKRMTEDFFTYAFEQPSFDQLDQATVLAAMAKWLHDANLDELLQPPAPDGSIQTPNSTRLLKVAAENSSGPVTVGLEGGVAYCKELLHVRDTNSRSRSLTNTAVKQRPAGASTWAFNDNGVVMKAAALRAKTPVRGRALGIRNPQASFNDQVDKSDRCVTRVFRLVGPMITNVAVNNSGDPITLNISGFDLGTDGRALYNHAPLQVLRWTTDQVVALLPSTMGAGTLVLQSQGRESNAVTFTQSKGWEQKRLPKVVVINKSDSPLRVELRPIGGGSPRILDLRPQERQEVQVTPGRYTAAAQISDQWYAGGGVSEERIFERGYSYTLTYEGSKFPTGDLVVTNETDGNISIEVIGPGGKTFYIPTGGRNTLHLAPGSYTLRASTPCGPLSEPITIKAGTILTTGYKCEKKLAETGVLQVNNGTNGSVTVSVNGRIWTAAAGASVKIELSAGNYGVQITSICGPLSKSVQIQPSTILTTNISCR